MLEEEARAGMERTFRAHDRLLTNVAAFKYLGNIITDTNDACPAVVANLWKARKK